ncbi:Catabolite control protein A [Corynebacterium ciconiae DSM 44920]|uniref:LacI family DNA-binding transcriptional regulator n=1 Tax=Corynebacterium ciconiae TaxID=227319 RepID=UPI000361B84E|nr:LacI family DNA-binding transcriptional regulator [Corynebacterium ciconiae]WKD60486.1 Catabolite control protein A [Corynebacterium ciconiae DSM 44920]
MGTNSRTRSTGRSTNGSRGTLASIAAELGVSRTTVSNAYNRPEQLSEALREKILATARRVGYTGPDPTARSLRMKKTGNVGVLLTEHLPYAFEDSASVDFLAGLAESTVGRDVALTLVPCGPETSEDKDLAAGVVNSSSVDGFVVYSVSAADPYLQAARQRGLPLVICDQPDKYEGLPYVGINDYDAIAPAAQALIDAGHRNIGILCIRLANVRHDGFVDDKRLHTATMNVQQDRVRGALDVLATAGIDPATVPIVERHINDRENNVDAARELLTSHPELTAVLCTTDSMAIGVLEYARSCGLRVPEDLSVTGFDGTTVALLRNLTTVIQPNKRKGTLTGELLSAVIDAAEGGPEPESTYVQLETTFNEGSTVARPRI